MVTAPFEFVDGAQVIVQDKWHGYVLSWWGGHVIRVFNLIGKEVAVWSLVSSGEESASTDEVMESIMNNIESGEYTDLIDWS